MFQQQNLLGDVGKVGFSQQRSRGFDNRNPTTLELFVPVVDRIPSMLGAW